MHVFRKLKEASADHFPQLTHEDSVISRANVHVAHAERPKAVEDCAHCNHPHYQQRHCVSSVEYKFSVF